MWKSILITTMPVLEFFSNTNSTKIAGKGHLQRLGRKQHEILSCLYSGVSGHCKKTQTGK
jgi:hypothetical protein